MKYLLPALLLVTALGAGCFAPPAQPIPVPQAPTPSTSVPPPTQEATIPDGWATYTNPDPSFGISYPVVPQDAVDVPQAPDDVFAVNIGSDVVVKGTVPVPETALHIKVVDATSTRLSNCAYAEQGWDNGSPVRLEKLTINGREFCLRVDSEGAAGNRYNTFAYATKVGEKTVVISFTVHSIACENFGDPSTPCYAFVEARDTQRFPEILKTFTIPR